MHMSKLRAAAVDKVLERGRANVEQAESDYSVRHLWDEKLKTREVSCAVGRLTTAAAK